eukprot:9444512-Alexandrium_andersonii.AAC.1
MSASLVGSEMCIRDRPWCSTARGVQVSRDMLLHGHAQGHIADSFHHESCLLYTSDAADDM